MFRVLMLVLSLAVAAPSLDVQRVERSVVRFTSAKGTCTAFAVRLYTYVTAHHCISDTTNFRIDDTEVTVVKDDPKVDLAMVSCGACQLRSGLPLAKDEPKIGEVVTGIGYAGPIGEYPLFETGEIVTSAAEFEWLKHPVMLTNVNWIAGQSGGPVVNRAGEVVGVIVGGFDEGSLLENFGASITYHDLKKFLKN